MAALLSHLLDGGAAGLAAYGGGRAVPGAEMRDPFDGGMWDLHREEYLGNPAEWRADPAMLVLAPRAAEDAGHVPVMLDATGLDGQPARIVVTIDYSPLPLALIFHPGRALPLLGFGVKYEIAGPIRASAQMGDGSLRMGGAFVDALGGGCTAPAATHARPDWQQGFGEMRARLWPESGRLRVGIRHPMDTGLADGIPAHHLTELRLLDALGEEIAKVELRGPVEENPVLTFALPADLARGPVAILARDTNGDRFQGEVRP